MLLSGNVRSMADAEIIHRSLIGPTNAEEEDKITPEERQELRKVMLGEAAKMLFTRETHTKFLEVGDITMLSLLTNTDIALVDMPELLLRMKVAHGHSLAELQDIFNFIMNKMKRRDGPCISAGQAATLYFPEVFARPRDEYVAAMIKEIAMHAGEHREEPISAINCYLGNVHTGPIKRLLTTYNSDGNFASETAAAKRGKSVLLGKKKKRSNTSSGGLTLDYIKLS